MNHPLDGERLKVDRAQEYLDALKIAIAKYVESDPCMVIVENDSAGNLAPRTEISYESDPGLRTIIGDCLSNSRSALDYIVWELASRYAGRELVVPPFGTDKPYFPIYVVPNKCVGYINSLSQYNIPAGALDEIRAVQPYFGGYQPLCFLHLLVNSDKHRLPVILHSTVSSVTVSVIHKKPSHTLDANPSLSPISNINDVEVNAHATAYVASDDLLMPPEPIDRTLENISKCVADIIPRFDRFFT